MTTGEWISVSGIIVGAGCALLLAIGPWMFTVHAKLAVIATEIGALNGKVDKLFELHNEQRNQCISHSENFAAVQQSVINGTKRMDRIETEAAK